MIFRLSTLAFAAVLWGAGNLAHTAWVQTRRFFWERRFRRTREGLLPDAEDFTLGTGSIALLFIHGFADTPRIWRRIAQRLAERGDFTCRAIRLAGSAEPASRANRLSLHLWRTQIADELTRLRLNHPHVWMIGHSMGGALALDTALRLPESIDGVAVFAPLIEVSPNRSPILPAEVWFRMAQVFLALSPTFESPFSSTGVAVDDPDFTYLRDRFIPFPVYRSLFELVRANRSRASQLSLPLYAVTAARDSVVDTPAALRWLATCPSVKKVRSLSNIGHVIPLETGWTTLTDELATFISQQTSS